MSSIMLASLETQPASGDDTSFESLQTSQSTVPLPLLQCTVLSCSLDLAAEYSGAEWALCRAGAQYSELKEDYFCLCFKRSLWNKFTGISNQSVKLYLKCKFLFALLKFCSLCWVQGKTEFFNCQRVSHGSCSYPEGSHRKKLGSNEYMSPL